MNGVRFRLFAVQGKDAADAQSMMGRYLTASQSAAAAGPEGWAKLADPLNGEVLVAWKGRWLWGAVDSSAKERRALVEELGRNLAALEP